MTTKRTLAIALFALSLAACQKEGGNPPAATHQSASAAVSAEAGGIAASASPVLTVIPATLSRSACDAGIEAVVTWDASAAGVNTEGTEIWVGSDANDLKLFSAGPAKGDTKTGPWTHPGTHFALKNKADGKVIGDAIVGGPHCT